MRCKTTDTCLWSKADHRGFRPLARRAEAVEGTTSCVVGWSQPQRLIVEAINARPMSPGSIQTLTCQPGATAMAKSIQRPKNATAMRRQPIAILIDVSDQISVQSRGEHGIHSHRAMSKLESVIRLLHEGAGLQAHQWARSGWRVGVCDPESRRRAAAVTVRGLISRTSHLHSP